MRLSQIKYILEIEKYGSITNAAKNLYISQPALSSTLNDLEMELGVQLFKRTKNGCEVTKAGKDILKIMKNIEKEMNYISSYMDSAYDTVGEITGAVGYACDYLCAELFARFKEKFPKAKLILTNKFYENVDDNVHKNFLDFSILARFEGENDFRYTLPENIDNSLSIIELKECKSYVVMNKNHTKTNISEIKLSELINEQLIIAKQLSAHSFIQNLNLEFPPIYGLERSIATSLVDKNVGVFIDAAPLEYEQYQKLYPMYHVMSIINDVPEIQLEWPMYFIYKKNFNNTLQKEVQKIIFSILSDYKMIK